MGKFARVAVQTANIDYNGRLCMVSAGAASKKVFGVDRSANPWSDIPKAKVILVAGANVAECAPITTDYLWQARENGGKLIIMDPRMTPIARNADLFIPVRSGGDIGVFHGMMRIMIQRGWIDREYIDNYTTGFDEFARVVDRYTPEYASKIAGVPADMIVKAAEMWGPAPTSFLLHARGIEHHSKGVENCISAIQLVLATGRIGREGCGYAMITGQGNGQVVAKSDLATAGVLKAVHQLFVFARLAGENVEILQRRGIERLEAMTFEDVAEDADDPLAQDHLLR